jgi:UDP-2-acetamido-2-deoxy-ribo-hexuluronate aminotransferase
MDTLQCAVVLAKLERFDEEIAQRQAVARRYHELLGSAEFWTESLHHQGESLPIRVLSWPAEDRTSVFAQYTILADDRDALQASLNADGIPTAIHYPLPLNEQPAYAHLCCPDCTPVAKKTAKRVLSLPMHPDLPQETQRHIVTALSALCQDSHKRLSEREDETAAHQQI